MTIAYDVERDISHYLLTITAINAALGVFIAIAMTFIGMPNPVLWGVAAALLNFIPYVGAFAGITMVGIVALISFESLSFAAIPPLIYTTAAVIEGQFLTPIWLGRRLELNSVAIFVFVAFWTWLGELLARLSLCPCWYLSKFSVITLKVLLALVSSFLAGTKLRTLRM